MVGRAPETIFDGPVGVALAADGLKVLVVVRSFGRADFNRSGVQYASVAAASCGNALMYEPEVD